MIFVAVVITHSNIISWKTWTFSSKFCHEVNPSFGNFSWKKSKTIFVFFFTWKKKSHTLYMQGSRKNLLDFYCCNLIAKFNFVACFAVFSNIFCRFKVWLDFFLTQNFCRRMERRGFDIALSDEKIVTDIDRGRKVLQFENFLMVK